MQSLPTEQSTTTMVNTYATVEVSDTDRERAQHWFEDYGWDTDKDYTALATLRIGHCGANVGKLMAASRRDKRPGTRFDAPSAVAQLMATETRAVKRPTPKITTTPKPAAVSQLPETTDYHALYLSSLKAQYTLAAEVRYLNGLLAKYGVAAVKVAVPS